MPWIGPAIGAAGSILGGAMGGGGGGGGGDAGAAIYQAKLDAKAQDKQNMFNNPDLISNQGKVERRFIKGTPAVKARPAKYDKKGNLIRPAVEAKPAVPGRWEVTETLRPEMKATQDAAMKAQQEQAAKAAAQGDFVAPEQVQWEDDGSAQEYADKFRERAMFGVADQQKSDMEKFNTRLRQQGLQPGTAAYDRAMKNLMTSQGDVSTRASLDAWLASGQERRANTATRATLQNQNYGQALEKYGMPLSRALGFGGLNQGTYARYPSSGVTSGNAGAPDIMSAYNAAQDRAQANKNASTAAWGEAFKGVTKAATDYYSRPANPNTNPNYNASSGMMGDWFT